MADVVQPNSTTVEQLLKRSYSLWSSYVATSTDLRLPAECVQLRNLLGKVPTFPTYLLQADGTLSTLQYHHSNFGLRISGASTWRTSQGECKIPPKNICHELLCGISKSVGCSFAEQSHFTDWPGVREGNGQTIVRDGRITEGNHLAILLLAWAYILSARWVELQSSYDLRCSFPLVGMHYSDLKAARSNNDEDISTGAITINIGDSCERAARWWAAILAPGEGWHAKIQVEGKTYQSPWSAYIASSQVFKLRTKDVGVVSQKQSDVPPPSDKALEYLCEYCELHEVDGQCIPALAASLFLPWKNTDQDASVILPFPKISQRLISKPQRELLSGSLRLKKCLQSEFRLLPYYMTLSSNIRGLRALLSGTFFDPTVTCNLVSPWMQPVFDIVDPIIAREEFTSLAIIMSRRQPALATLWLGAIILGMEETILRPVRNGLFAVELHAAAWTGTVHSFINLSPNTPCITRNNEIHRSDECRLLYLTGSESYQRAPVCPWQPFGTTPLGSADIEVQQHATCKGHCLQYVGWRWDTASGLSCEDQGFSKDAIVDQWGLTADDFGLTSVTSQTNGFLRSELLSETATRSIFGWLRMDGYPPVENAIFTHDWFDVGSSSEESALGETDPLVMEQSRIAAWLDGVERDVY